MKGRTWLSRVLSGFAAEGCDPRQRGRFETPAEQSALTGIDNTMEDDSAWARLVAPMQLWVTPPVIVPDGSLSASSHRRLVLYSHPRNCIISPAEHFRHSVRM